jgi:hypothetical protein
MLIREGQLESSQHYNDGGPFLNPVDHPAERTPSEEEVEGEVENVRGECIWMFGEECVNPIVFEHHTRVNGGYCTSCEEWDDGKE